METEPFARNVASDGSGHSPGDRYIDPERAVLYVQSLFWIGGRQPKWRDALRPGETSWQ